MKKFIYFIFICSFIYLSASAYCFVGALGERLRHFEMLGRGYGLGLMNKCDEDKNYKSKTPDFFIDYPNTDNYWYGYKFIIKEGVRVPGVDKDQIIAAFLPTKGVPNWSFFKPAGDVLVCYGDLHVGVLLAGEVDFKL